MSPVVAIYLRISLDRNNLGIGVARQRKDCTAIAHARYPNRDIREYVDNDESAYSPRAKRPAYQQMLTDIAAGRITAVIGWDQDRLLRQPRQLEALIDLCVPLNVPVITARGDLDLASHDGQLYARISAAVAKKSSDDTSRRVKRAAKDRAEAGQFHGARYTPYGLTRVDGRLVHDPVAVECIQAMTGAILDGMSLQRAIREIAPQYPGARTSREGWRLILTGEIVRGRNTQGFPAAWPAMIDPTSAASLDVMLQPRSSRRPNRDWPLAGYLWCGVCGARLYGHREMPSGTTTNGRVSVATYVCPKCWGVSVAEKPLTTFVREVVESTVVVVARELQPVPGEDHRAEVLEHLATEYAAGRISRGEWEAARGALPMARRRERVRMPVDPSVSLTFAQKLAHTIDRITILPATSRGPSFDTGRVRIEYLR